MRNVTVVPATGCPEFASSTSTRNGCSNGDRVVLVWPFPPSDVTYIGGFSAVVRVLALAGPSAASVRALAPARHAAAGAAQASRRRWRRAGPAGGPGESSGSGRAGCAAYLRFADERPGQYRVLFGRYQRLGDRPAGRAAIRAEAFNLLLTALRDCASTGQIASDDLHGDAVIIWAALHGYATLRAGLPHFDWPDPQAVLDRILSRYAPAAHAPGQEAK